MNKSASAIINKLSMKTQTVSSIELEVDDYTTDSQKDVVNHFVNFFKDVTDNVVKSIPRDETYQFIKYSQQQSLIRK